MQQTYAVGRYIFGVRTNSEEFGEWMADAFSEFRSSEDLGATYSVHVSDDTDGLPGKRFHVLYRQTLVLAKTLDLGDVVKALRADFESYYFGEWSESVYMEVAPVTSDGSTVLIPQQGIALLSDPTIRRAIDRAGVTFPVGSRLALDPATGALLRPPRLDMPESALEKLRELVPGDWGSTMNGAALETQPSAICILVPVNKADTQVRPVPRAHAIKMLADQDVVNLERVGIKALEALTRFTEGIPCYELRYFSADDLLEGLMVAMRAQPTEPVAIASS